MAAEAPRRRRPDPPQAPGSAPARSQGEAIWPSTGARLPEIGRCRNRGGV